MIIEDIKLANMDLLYEGFDVKMDNGKNFSFGMNIFEFLEHCSISILMKDITLTELYFLNQLTKDIKIFNKEITTDRFKDNKELLPTIESLTSIYEDMQEDNDVNKDSDDIDTILPSGCFTYEVLAVFKGASLTSVTGGNVRNVFLDRGQMPDIYPGNKTMENMVAEHFYNNFYRYVADSLTRFDLVTNFMLSKKFYNYTNSICVFSGITGAYGGVRFFDSNQQLINTQIKTIQKSLAFTKELDESLIYLNFSMKTTFSTFMNFVLNSNYVVEHENFNILLVKNDDVEVPDIVTTKYGIRVSEAVRKVKEEKNKLRESISTNKNESKTLDLNLYNYIFGGLPIYYSIRIPYSDIHGTDLTKYTKGVELDNIQKEVNTSIKAAKAIFKRQ